MNRSWVVFRGTRTQTEAQAREYVGAHESLWVSDRHEAGAALGRSVPVVVLDLHAGFDPDVLGRVHGCVVAGGALVMRMPDAPVRDSRLAVHPHGPEDVGTALWERLEAGLRRARVFPLEPVQAFSATTEQDALVRGLSERFQHPGCSAVIADRGRGKSAAVGRAIAGRGALVTASRRSQAAEVLRFAPDARFVLPLEALETRADLVVVDEAAALSVPLLRALCAAHPEAHIVFVSTVDGYEGHGRGFSLRVLPELPDVAVFRPVVPIRWAPCDPLEESVRRVLLLDAGASERSAPVGEISARPMEEADLEAVFGLLIDAHYRTTPADLSRLLDAPNLQAHVLADTDSVLAACLVAREGELPEDVCRALYQGDRRIRGHALPETLVAHLGCVEAGGWRWIRSVRTATHPDHRRRGMARQLVESVHQRYAPDGFGTLFGATPDLLRFRRALGYQLVRVGVSRNSRSGEPSVLMVRPVSPRARALVARLRRVLARDLPGQLERMAIDGIALDPRLSAALQHDLPEPARWTDAAIHEAVRAYAFGPRPYDLVAGAVERFLEGADLEPLARARVFERRSWAELAASTGMSVPAVMRAVRRAIATASERE